MRLGVYTNGASRNSVSLSTVKEKGTISPTILSLTISVARARCFLSLASDMLKVFSHLLWGLVF